MLFQVFGYAFVVMLGHAAVFAVHFFHNFMVMLAMHTTVVLFEVVLSMNVMMFHLLLLKPLLGHVLQCRLREKRLIYELAQISLYRLFCNRQFRFFREREF
jgi:hypothetical protein